MAQTEGTDRHFLLTGYPSFVGKTCVPPRIRSKRSAWFVGNASMYSDIIFFGGAVLGLIVGIIYFRETTPGSPMAIRLSSSAFGPAISAVYLATVFAWPEHLRYSSQALFAYYALQGLPLFLLLHSLSAYPGRRITHVVLAPVAVIAWLWTFVLGYWVVHGK